jgi:ABC-2 type transport system permease protein
VVDNAVGGLPLFGEAVALIFGAFAVGSEDGWDPLKTVLTQRPPHGAVYGGKLLALAALTVGLVLATVGLSAAASAVVAVLESAALDWPSLADLAQGIAAGAGLSIC